MFLSIFESIRLLKADAFSFREKVIDFIERIFVE